MNSLIQLKIGLIAVFLLALSASAQTVRWTPDPQFSACSICIYSATPTFSAKDKQDALVRILRQFNLSNAPSGWVANITNIMPITRNNLPPLSQRPLVAKVPEPIGGYKPPRGQMAQCFFITRFNSALGESEPATK